MIYNKLTQQNPNIAAFSDRMCELSEFEVMQAKDDDYIDWQKYVSLHDFVGHYFDWRWGSIFHDCFGHRPHRLIARRGSEVGGLLTLLEVRNPISGISLISMPYLNGGGALVDDVKVCVDLVRKTEYIGQSIGAKTIEIRNRGDEQQKLLDWVTRSHKVAMLLPLFEQPEQMFDGFSGKLRSQIRRADKAGLQTRISSGINYEESEIRGFYEVFSTNMKYLGTPVYPYRLFVETLRSFGSAATIFTCWLQGKCIAGAITIGSGAMVEVPWASSLREYGSVAANMRMYWEMIRKSCVDGYAIFDFGRSTPGSGTYRFKEQWGAKPLALHWHYMLRTGTRIPDRDPNSSRYRFATKVWRHLPISVTQTIGPWLTRWLP